MTLNAQLITGVSWALGEIKVTDNEKNQVCHHIILKSIPKKEGVHHFQKISKGS